MAVAALHRRRSSRALHSGVDSEDSTTLLLRPAPNVYSYFLFTAPVETSKPHGGCSFQLFCAFFLIALNVALQTFILYAIFRKVTLGQVDWANGIHPVLEFHPEKCNTGQTLCHDVGDGNITCAPPSVFLTGNNFANWEELDLNGDDVWTLDEVEKARDDLYCRYHVEPTEVFNVFVSLVLSHKDDLWIHPALANRSAIHLPYFKYAAGDIVMCGYGNEDMCPNLLRRGIFDSALRDGKAPRVGNTIASAMEYCRELLKPEGICETNLPSTYATWRRTSEQQCLAPKFESFIYTSPGSKLTKSFLAVNYEGVATFQEGAGLLFIVYKVMLVFVYLLGMLHELRDIICDLTFVAHFPNARDSQGNSCAKVLDEDGEPRYVITAVTSRHKTAVSVLVLLRIGMLAILTVAGIAFLLKETDYAELLLNTVGLVFILDIQSIVYLQVVHAHLKDEHEEKEPLRVSMMKFCGSDVLNKNPAMKDAIAFAGLTIVLLVGVTFYYFGILMPLYDSLMCNCLGEGDSCLEASRFAPSFWEQYWNAELPKALQDLKALEKSTGTANAGSASAAASAAAAAEAARKLLLRATPLAGGAAASAPGASDDAAVNLGGAVPTRSGDAADGISDAARAGRSGVRARQRRAHAARALAADSAAA